MTSVNCVVRHWFPFECTEYVEIHISDCVLYFNDIFVHGRHTDTVLVGETVVRLEALAYISLVRSHTSTAGLTKSRPHDRTVRGPRLHAVHSCVVVLTTANNRTACSRQDLLIITAHAPIPVVEKFNYKCLA